MQEKPNDLQLTADQCRLFVANGNRNGVSVIDTKTARVGRGCADDLAFDGKIRVHSAW